MQTSQFKNILLLLNKKKTFEKGLELAKNNQQEFENYFKCSIEVFKAITKDWGNVIFEVDEFDNYC